MKSTIFLVAFIFAFVIAAFSASAFSASPKDFSPTKSYMVHAE